MNNYGAKLKLSIGLLVIVIVFVLLSFNSNAATAPAIVSYQGKILDNGIAVSTSIQMNFKLFDALTGGAELYSNTSTITPSSGLFSVLLGSAGTTALDPTIFRDSDEIYLQVTVGTETLSPRKQIVTSPYAFNAKYLNGLEATSTPITSAYIPVTDNNGNISFNSVTTTGDLNVEGELKISQTSTVQNVLPESNGIFSLGSVVWRWLKGWFVDLDVINLFATNADIGTSTIANATITSSTLTSTTIVNAGIINLNAENATTTNLYTQTLTVSNTIRVGQICDKDGNNCYVPSAVNISITQVVTTTALFNGDITTGTLEGYVAVNNICNNKLSGSHMCSAEEIIYLIRAIGPSSLFNGLSYAWVSNGPPGYLAPSNDCNGWKSSLDNNYGPFWEFATSTGGRGVLSPCDQLKPLACCK